MSKCNIIVETGDSILLALIIDEAVNKALLEGPLVGCRVYQIAENQILKPEWRALPSACRICRFASAKEIRPHCSVAGGWLKLNCVWSKHRVYGSRPWEPALFEVIALPRC